MLPEIQVYRLKEVQPHAQEQILGLRSSEGESCYPNANRRFPTHWAKGRSLANALILQL